MFLTCCALLAASSYRCCALLAVCSNRRVAVPPHQRQQHLLELQQARRAEERELLRAVQEGVVLSFDMLRLLRDKLFVERKSKILGMRDGGVKAEVLTRDAARSDAVGRGWDASGLRVPRLACLAF